MARKRFDVPRRQRTEPIGFEIAVEMGEAEPPEVRLESFTCVPFCPGALLFEAWGALTGDVDPNGIVAFLREVVIDTDKTRFNEIIRDPDIAVPAQTLVDVADYVVGEYGKRPTEPPSPS